MANNKYVIKYGDTLSGIAAANNTTVENLMKLNGISDPNKIYAGNELILSAGDNTSGTKLGDMTGGSKVNYQYNGTPTTMPTFGKLPTNPTYDTTKWDDTAKGSAALGAYNTAKDAVTGYKDFTFSQQGWLDEILGNIKNYGDFSYDLNGDALYQQYKDKYIQQGKMAMADTMGQAAAMTGGYGNSYAQSVGQQAYQAQLEKLNDIVPQLYQMALDRYNMGKEDLYNQYGMLSSERQNEYGLHQDGYQKLLDALGIAQSDYYNGADLFHTEQNTANGVAGQKFDDAMALWDADTAQKWQQWNADETLRQYGNSEWWKNEEWEYGKDRDAKADEKWQKEFDAANVSDNVVGGSVTGGVSEYDDEGNLIVSPGTITSYSQIPSDILKKAGTFKSNDDLADWAYGLADTLVISPEVADQLIAANMDANEKYNEVTDEKGNTTRTVSYSQMIESFDGWEMETDGGGNLFGIDRDAVVKAPNGKSMTLIELKKTLIAEGMDESVAQKKIKALQQKLGISSNWLFGW